MTAKTSFGQWLKQRRKMLDITREELARRISCAASTIYKIEADKRRPSRQIAALLAEHLNIPPDERAAFIDFARTGTFDSPTAWGTPFHPPTNLLEQPTALIGRDEDVAAIRRRLLESRLLTLTGPPGIGKTCLSLQVAAQELDGFTDGVFFVILAPISDANLVAATIANTLGIPDAGPRTPLERLKIFLRDKQLLLVLDNFEQILAAAPPIAELLSACPWLKMLITSRSPLRIRQERQFPVPSLALPDLAHLPEVENVSDYSAVTLFMERAQAVKPDFSLTPENAPTVAAICTRLDGLPLAIELISARVKLLPPAALLERLHGRLMLQSDGLRDLEPRHRTLNAAIDWSYQLLNADEQALFRRLGVFVGGWTLEAAEAICVGDVGTRHALSPQMNTLDCLASLLDKNLVKRDGDSRFMMLETIREYALERLASGGELENLRQRHADYFTAFAEHTDEAKLFRTDPVHWLSLLEPELDNFRAALGWSETGLRLAVALNEFWMRHGHMSEAVTWLMRGLKQHEADRALRAKGLEALGMVLVWQDNLDAPQQNYEESLAIFRELGDTTGVANILGRLGSLFQMRGDHERSQVFLEESLALFRELGNSGGAAWVLILLGWLNYTSDNIQRAGVFWEESLAVFRTQNNPWGIASVLNCVAMVALDQGDYVRVNDHLTESLTRYQVGERWQILYTLDMFACLAVAQAQHTENPEPSRIRAARISGAVEALRESFGNPAMRYRGRTCEEVDAILRAQLDDSAFTAAWAEGRKMSLEQAVAYALET